MFMNLWKMKRATIKCSFSRRVSCLLLLFLLHCTLSSIAAILKNSGIDVNDLNNSVLAFVAKSAAGVYVNDHHEQHYSLTGKRKLSKDMMTVKSTLKSTIILTAANYAFRSHLQNFLCFTDRLGFKVLIASLDAEMHEFMQRNSSHLATTYFFHHEFAWARVSNQGRNISADFASWDTPEYNTITHAKIGISYELMKLGYDVIFCDPDVVIIRDPLPLMLWQNMDYVHTLDVPCQGNNEDWNYFYDQRVTGNTGFSLVRSNNRTIPLYKQVIDACIQEPKFNDQVHFWQQIRMLATTVATTTTRRSHQPPVLPIGKCRDLSHDDINKKLAVGDNNNSSSHNNSNNKSTLKESSPPPLTLCVLNSCQYSSCSIQLYTRLRQVLNATKSQAITLHANCLVGDEQKIGELKNVGLWMAMPLISGTLSSEQCIKNWTELTDEEVFERDQVKNANRRHRKKEAAKRRGFLQTQHQLDEQQLLSRTTSSTIKTLNHHHYQQKLSAHENALIKRQKAAVAEDASPKSYQQHQYHHHDMLIISRNDNLQQQQQQQQSQMQHDRHQQQRPGFHHHGQQQSTQLAAQQRGGGHTHMDFKAG